MPSSNLLNRQREQERIARENFKMARRMSESVGIGSTGRSHISMSGMTRGMRGASRGSGGYDNQGMYEGYSQEELADMYQQEMEAMGHGGDRLPASAAAGEDY